MEIEPWRAVVIIVAFSVIPAFPVALWLMGADLFDNEHEPSDAGGAS